MTTTILRGRPRIPGAIYGDKPYLRPTDLDSLFWQHDANRNAYKDAGSTLAANGDTVLQWNDQSPNLLHWVQNTAGNRPTFSTNIINGFPALSFNGTGNDMINTLVTAAAGNQCSFFFVVKPSSTSPIGIFDSAPNAAGTFRNYNTGQWEWQNAQPQFNLSLANTNAVLLCFITRTITGTTRQVKYYRNGVLVSTNTGTPGAMVWSGSIIGSINAGAAGWYSGYYAEDVLCSAPLDDTHRRGLENYFNAKYAIW